jgi:chromosome segregation ATPase
MTISQTESCRRKLKRAQADLDRRLEAGEDATAARAALTAAEAELSAAEQAAVERAEADEQRIEAEAAALSDAVSAEIGQALARIVERIGPLPGARVESRWALGVAKARRETDAARTAADATRERLAGQQTRLSSLKADRQGIIQRRLAGDERDSDAGAMALIAADIEGLSGLIARTSDELRRLDTELNNTTKRHARAEVRWTSAVQDAWCGALSELALLAEGVIVESADGMRANGGDRQRWSPGRHVAGLLHGKHF